MSDTEEEGPLNSNSSSLLPPSATFSERTGVNRLLQEENRRLQEENRILQQENMFLQVENEAYYRENILIRRQNNALWEENRNLYRKHVDPSREATHYELWQKTLQLRFKAFRYEQRVLRGQEVACEMWAKAILNKFLALWEENKAKFLQKFNGVTEEEEKAVYEENIAHSAWNLSLLEENRALRDSREALHSQREDFQEEHKLLHEWYNILQEKK